ncbi:bifunctional metallophosphatase/5'-nucleotidase [bacterium]|nr:bifunctional metallophosphatase/5'-nucleotidase [bacterium]
MKRGLSAPPPFRLLAAVAVYFCFAGCIKQSKTSGSLPRAFVDTSTANTCAALLPASEYQSLVRQLTVKSPLGIVSTNDLHGHLDPRRVSLTVSPQDEREVVVGGAELLASYLAALCRHYKGRLAYFDTGDSYQGTLLSSLTSGQAVLETFSSLGLRASTFGNHEFDFGQMKIREWLATPQRSFWYVTSSLNGQENGHAIPWQDLHPPRFAKSVVFDVEGIKLGIAGYTTESTPVKSIPTHVAGLAFKQLNDVLDQEAQPLRQQGAQINILLSHAGGACDMRLPAAQGENACPQSNSDELGQALRASPQAKNNWNLVIAGHSHAAQRHLIGGVPVVQSTGLGLSLTHTTIDLSLPQPEVQLHNPIYLCETHFQNWAGCHPEELAWRNQPSAPIGPAKAPELNGITIRKADGQRVATVLSTYRSQLAEQLKSEVTSTPVELTHDRTGKSPAAACLVDAWLAGLRASGDTWGDIRADQLDMAVLNSGALRSGIPAGSLTFGRLFEIIPYDNTAHVVRLNSAEILAFARAQEASPHDYFLVSEGYVVQRRSNNSPAPRTLNIHSVQTLQQPKQTQWQVAISTFSRTFLEKAGLQNKVIDTGMSVRDTIADALKNKDLAKKSCRSADSSRMEISPSNN